MKENGSFYKPEEIKQLYAEIVPVYQTAFSGEPWFEISKCADTLSIQRCVGGLSSLSLGQLCELCGNRPIRPAYEKEELIDRFETFTKTRPTAWYLEKNENGITLAAIAWIASSQVISNEKYRDVPEIEQWMMGKLGKNPIVWLDEVFADRIKKPKGNLKNFRTMCLGLAKQLGTDIIAFRTINDRMIAATVRDFGPAALVYKRIIDVPDRRDFVIINLGGVK